MARSGSRTIRRPKRPYVPALGAGTMADLLSGEEAGLVCSLLAEPLLLFDGKQSCEDPKTGLTAFGPYSKSDVTRRPVIRIGIVGPAEAIDRARHLVEQLSARILHSEKNDALLHPGFPGMNHLDPFQIQLVSQDIWCRPLPPSQVAKVECHADFTQRIQLLLDYVIAEVEALSRLDSGPDIVLIAMTASLEAKCRVGIAAYDKAKRDAADDEDDDGAVEDVVEEVDEEGEVVESADERPDAARSFRRGLKAACMNLLPTQLLWHRTLAGTRGVQDLATRAWNLSVALMYKARVIPWRLADVIDGACYVGTSFFHPDDNPTSTRTSVAQAFTHRGEGFVLQGEPFTWKPSLTEKSPHLDRAGAKSLMERVLKVYDDEVHGLPNRVIVHKTSRYTQDEQDGLHDALGSIRDTALVTLSHRGIPCMRPGSKPVLRGTLTSGRRRGWFTPPDTFRSCAVIRGFGFRSRWRSQRTGARSRFTRSRPISYASRN